MTSSPQIVSVRLRNFFNGGLKRVHISSYPQKNCHKGYLEKGFLHYESFECSNFVTNFTSKSLFTSVISYMSFWSFCGKSNKHKVICQHCNPLQGSTGKYRENPVMKTGNLQWEQGSPVMKAGISLWELTYRVSL